MQAQRWSSLLRAARVIVIEGWSEAMRILFGVSHFEKGYLSEVSPSPVKSVQSLRTRDFRVGLRWDYLLFVYLLGVFG